MKIDTAAEIVACLESPPGGDCSTDQVKRWLFTAQNSVAVRLGRIVEGDDKTARTLLTARAERTWVRVTDPKGKAQRLWARLSTEFLSLAKSKANSLQAKVEFAPKGMLASVFPPEGTGRQIAAQCYEWCQSPLAVKADLIFPLHAVFGQMPVDKAVWRWRKYVAGREYAVEIPPVGDFVAAMVMNRLAMMVSLAGCLGHLADDWAVLRPFVGQNKEIVLARDDWERDLVEELQAVRDDIYDTPDAQERAGALALLQVYLALENYQRRFAADWTVIPWPADADPENPVILIIDRPEQMDLDKLPMPMDHIYLFRGEALGAVFTHALKEQPGEVVSIVKGGLKWLAGTLSEAPLADADYAATNKQEWDKNDSDFVTPAAIRREYPDGKRLTEDPDGRPYLVAKLKYPKLKRIVESGKYRTRYMELDVPQPRKRQKPRKQYKIHQADFAQMVKDFPEAIGVVRLPDKVALGVGKALLGAKPDVPKLPVVVYTCKRGCEGEIEVLEGNPPPAKCPNCHNNTMFPKGGNWDKTDGDV